MKSREVTGAGQVVWRLKVEKLIVERELNMKLFEQRGQDKSPSVYWKLGGKVQKGYKRTSKESWSLEPVMKNEGQDCAG